MFSIAITHTKCAKKKSIQKKEKNIVRLMNGSFMNGLHDIKFSKLKRLNSCVTNSGMEFIKMLGLLYTRR